jgi:hypothetical protein
MAPPGEYLDQMFQEAYNCDLRRVGGGYGCDHEPKDTSHYLYKCVNEGDRVGPGVIEFIEDCSGGWYCSNNGSGKNDSCKPGR